jgi:predicted metal-dependent HD superfamily phosphohydrolase
VAVLIDPPRWPAHGTHFSHLVSDTALGELLEFADANGVPVRAFDHDHYDVPERRHAELVGAGAVPVSESELLRRLVASGLRVRTPERTPKPAQVLPALAAAWHDLLPSAPGLGRELVRRWQEPHRHYHDVRHLAQVLGALDLLADGPVPRPVRLAAWFHDAVYDGEPGADEERSADLAAAELTGAGLPADEVAEVVRLVGLTVHHDPGPDDPAGVLLVDADLSILGQPPGRYHVYSRDVRLEYSRFSDEIFAAGRVRVLDALSSFDPLYRSATARRLWEAQSIHNLVEERNRWLRFLPSTG